MLCVIIACLGSSDFEVRQNSTEILCIVNHYYDIEPFLDNVTKHTNDPEIICRVKEIKNSLPRLDNIERIGRTPEQKECVDTYKLLANSTTWDKKLRRATRWYFRRQLYSGRLYWDVKAQVNKQIKESYVPN